jgi:hypothetical protein
MKRYIALLVAAFIGASAHAGVVKTMVPLPITGKLGFYNDPKEDGFTLTITPNTGAQREGHQRRNRDDSRLVHCLATTRKVESQGHHSLRVRSVGHVAIVGCDCHGMDHFGMALERRFGLPSRQVPNTQRVVGSAVDHVATIGCDCHGIDPGRMAFKRRFDFPTRQVPNTQRDVPGAGDDVATIPAYAITSMRIPRSTCRQQAMAG